MANSAARSKNLYLKVLRSWKASQGPPSGWEGRLELNDELQRRKGFAAFPKLRNGFSLHLIMRGTDWSIGLGFTGWSKIDPWFLDIRLKTSDGKSTRGGRKRLRVSKPGAVFLVG